MWTIAIINRTALIISPVTAMRGRPERGESETSHVHVRINETS